jgi:PAS domain S-box-containing protein
MRRAVGGVNVGIKSHTFLRRYSSWQLRLANKLQKSYADAASLKLSNVHCSGHGALVESRVPSPKEIYARWKQEPLRLFDEAPVAITVFDDDLRYLDGNDAACQLLQITQEELSTKRVGELSRDSQFARRVRDTRGRSVFEENLRLPRKDGSERFVNAITRPNIVPGLHLCFYIDVTEKQKLQ